ncbi:MAG: hypothetical protein J7L59_01105 [Nanoarchaeota archaeon]|nr:hypothetical protein [Nanoarchaeota archaeon]
MLKMDVLRKKQAKEVAKGLGMRFPDSAIAALDRKVVELIKEAANRAKANKRKTITEYDF